jgi:membrane protease YdiL (CAAX protease family)
MKQPLLAVLTPFSRLLFSVILVLSCFLAFFIAGILLAIPLFGINLFSTLSVLNDFGDPANVALLKFLQIVQSLGLFIVPPLLAGFLFAGNTWRYLGLNRLTRPVNFLLVLVMMFAALPFINWLVALNLRMDLPAFLGGLEAWMKSAETEAQELTEAFLNAGTTGGFLLNLFMLALLPAVGEELLFRGLIQRLLGEWLRNIHLAIWISALIFGVMHMQFFGLLPRVLLGALFGYLFYRTGSLWIPIWAHFINNAAAVVAAWLGQRGTIGSNYEEFGATDNPFLIALSFAAIVAILYLVSRFSGPGRVNSDEPREGVEKSGSPERF